MIIENKHELIQSAEMSGVIKRGLGVQAPPCKASHLQSSPLQIQKCAIKWTNTVFVFGTFHYGMVEPPPTIKNCLATTPLAGRIWILSISKGVYPSPKVWEGGGTFHHLRIAVLRKGLRCVHSSLWRKMEIERCLYSKWCQILGAN